MIYNTLGKTGLQVSKMGFGCAPLGNEYGALDERAAIHSVHAAIDGGINFLIPPPIMVARSRKSAWVRR